MISVVLNNAVASVSGCREEISRVVTDVSISNKPAWGVLQKFGFVRGVASATTAEAVLDLHAISVENLFPAATITQPRSTAARAAPSLASRISNISGQGVLRRFVSFSGSGRNNR
jgi:hypothetical protein